MKLSIIGIGGALVLAGSTTAFNAEWISQNRNIQQERNASSTMNPQLELLMSSATDAGEPIGACCVDAVPGCIDGLTLLQCNAEPGGLWFQNLACSQIGCGDVEGACCVKEACYEVEFIFCDAIGGEWLGYNETCEVDTCSTPPQYGACCINGEAISLYDYDCIRILGTFMGEGTNPDDVTCPVHCAEDVTGDGVVDVSDLLAIIAVWGACP